MNEIGTWSIYKIAEILSLGKKNLKWNFQIIHLATEHNYIHPYKKWTIVSINLKNWKALRVLKTNINKFTVEGAMCLFLNTVKGYNNNINSNNNNNKLYKKSEDIFSFLPSLKKKRLNSKANIIFLKLI